MQCQACKFPFMQRTARKNFLEGKVYTLFGGFPWEFPRCSKVCIIKDRGDEKNQN